MPMMNRREFGLAGLTSLTSLALTMKPAAALQTTGGRAYRYVHLDVFTDRRMAGNQLLVFVQPDGLDADMMLALTRESNYSECTFVFPPEQAGTDHRVRIFTRNAETPFDGHPTIGTVFALVHARVLKPGTLKTTFGLGVGPTNIDIESTGARMDDAAEADVRQDDRRSGRGRRRNWFRRRQHPASAGWCGCRSPAAGPGARCAGGQLRLNVPDRAARLTQGG